MSRLPTVAAAVIAATMALGMAHADDDPFEPSRTEYHGSQVRMEFESFVPGVCAIKTWVGLRVYPEVELVYERLCSAGGTLVRYDYCVRMARGEE